MRQVGWHTGFTHVSESAIRHDGPPLAWWSAPGGVLVLGLSPLPALEAITRPAGADTPAQEPGRKHFPGVDCIP